MATASRDPITSLPVRRSTLRLLQNLKTGAQTWDEFFHDWAEHEMDRLELVESRSDVEEYRRRPEPTVSLTEVHRQIRSRRGR